MAHPMEFGRGLLLQIVGMLVAVIAAFRTSGRMSKFSGGATYDNIDSFLKTMAHELRGGSVAWRLP